MSSDLDRMTLRRSSGEASRFAITWVSLEQKCVDEFAFYRQLSWDVLDQPSGYVPCKTLRRKRLGRRIEIEPPDIDWQRWSVGLKAIKSRRQCLSVVSDVLWRRTSASR